MAGLRLCGYLFQYQTLFKNKTKSNFIKAKQYVEGIVLSDLKNIERISEALEANYHHVQHFISDSNWDARGVKERLLVISIKKTKDGEEIEYSFTNASLAQYTEQAIAYMQAQRLFIEHSFKEQKQILGLDQFQTRKWLSWYHQVALNLLVGSFMLKEKLLSQENIPLLSARNIMEFLIFRFYKEMTEERLLAALQERHRKRL